MSFIKKNFKYVYLMAILLLPVILTKKNVDNDTWFILNLGRYTLNNGFTFVDPFSMHEGLSYIFQQWLSGVYFYSLYKLGGQTLLISIMVLESILMLYIMYKLIMLVSGKNYWVSVTLTALFSIFASVYMTTRPEITTYIILITELLMLEKYIDTGKWQFLIALPLLSIIEINLHAATWPLLFIFILPYMCSLNILKKIKSISVSNFRKLPILISVLFMLFGGFINPYGYKAMIYLLKSGGAKYKTFITELKATTFIDFWGLYILITFIIGLYLIFKNKINVQYIFLFAGTFLMTIIAFRNISFYGLGVCILFGSALKNVSYKGKYTNYILYPFGITLILALLILSVDCISSGITVKENVKNWQEIVLYLNKNTDKNIKLFTDFNSGGYFEFNGYKASIDARMELYTKKMNKKYDYYDEFILFNRGYIYYKDYLDKYNFDYVVIANSCPAKLSLDNDNTYGKCVQTSNYALFKRGND